MTKQGIGASLLRKEDARFLRGRGSIVGDIQLAGMHEVAFLRSPVAHARILSIRMPPASRPRLHRRRSGRGEPIRPTPACRLQVLRISAACDRQGAPRRRAGRDVRRADARRGRGPRAAHRARSRAAAGRRRHAGGARRPVRRWCTSSGATTCFCNRDRRGHRRGRRQRAVVGRRELRTCAPGDDPDGRPRRASPTGTTALDQLVVNTSTQVPHLVRTGLAECLGLDEGSVRVIAPDVGGGFGYKCVLQPEEVRWPG